MTHCGPVMTFRDRKHWLRLHNVRYVIYWNLEMIVAPNLQNVFFFHIWRGLGIQIVKMINSGPVSACRDRKHRLTPKLSDLRYFDIGGSKSSKWLILVEFQNFGTENIHWRSKSPKCYFFLIGIDFGSNYLKCHIVV